MSTFILKRYGFRCCVDDGQAQEQDSVMSVIIRNEISFFNGGSMSHSRNPPGPLLRCAYASGVGYYIVVLVMIPIPMIQIGQKFILENYPLFNPISIPFCESER